MTDMVMEKAGWWGHRLPWPEGRLGLAAVAAGVFVLGLLFAYWPIIVSIGFLLVAFIIIVYARPEIGAYVLMAFIPLRSFYLMYFNGYRAKAEIYPISMALVVLVFAICLASRLVAKRPRRAFAGDFSLALFSGFAWLSLLWTYDPYRGTFMASSLVISLMTLAIFQDAIRTRRQLVTVLIVLLASMVVYATMMGLSLTETGEYVWTYSLGTGCALQFEFISLGMRAGGFDSPHASSNAMVMALFVLLIFAFSGSVLRRLVLFAMACFFLVEMFMSGNKGAVVSLLPCIFLIVLLHKPLRRHAASWIGGAMVVVLAIFGLSATLFKADRLTASSKITTESFTLRFEYWRQGFVSMDSTAWFGWGIGGFDRVIAPVPHAHSLYFNILFDLGIIGLALFLLFVVVRGYSVVRSIITAGDEQLRLILCCLAVALVSLMIFGLVEFSYMYFHIWAYLGVLGAAQAIAASPSGANSEALNV